jgi:putative tryptophan/tyrosine transport system substrate-binding protein
LAPGVARVALIYNPDIAPFAGLYISSITAANASAVKLPIRHASEIEPSVTNFAKEPNSGLIVLPDAFTVVNRELIVAIAAQHRLPAIYPFRFFATTGGLISYGTDPAEAMRQAARSQARRPSCAGADQVRAGHQPQNRKRPAA